jgi:hypothetical protein
VILRERDGAKLCRFLSNFARVGGNDAREPEEILLCLISGALSELYYRSE